jgi:hypothetical protein
MHAAFGTTFKAKAASDFVGASRIFIFNFLHKKEAVLSENHQRLYKNDVFDF